MKKKIIDYSEFILESKLELLLEANIAYTDKFKKILDEIDSPISRKLKELSGKEVDVNTNFIDIDSDKKDTVLFTPDNKTTKIPTTIFVPGFGYTGVASRAKSMGYTIGNIGIPELNAEVEVIKELSPDETQKFFGGSGYKTTHIKFKDKDGKECETFYSTKYLGRNISNIKQSEVKVGRFATSILKKAGVEFKPTEIEDFVSKYKTAIQMRNDIFKRFEIVSGKDIKKYYNENSYYQNGGTLGSSCMRYSKCSSFLDIYSENPDQVSLIILRSEKDTEKIIGRAILWTDNEDRRFMDRVYIIDHSNQTLFVEYARKNKFYYKKNQTYSEGDPIMFDGKELSMEDSIVVVQLEEGDFRQYPYADTLKYLDKEEGIITNNSDAGYECELTDTDGGDGSCETCGGSGEIECGECDGSGEYECGECDGRGQISCGECDGSGESDCYDCEGRGVIDCRDCNGSGDEECENCGGDGVYDGIDGEEECDECSGSGRKVCSTCDGDSEQECGRCRGDGTLKCDDCSGDGEIECGSCDGNGEVECGTCEGRGRADCYDCNS